MTGKLVNGHEVDALTLRDIVRTRAKQHGDKAMVIVDDDVLTYADADRRANRIANSLRERGVVAGDVVATYMYNSTDHAATWFACGKLGAIWAPMNIALIRLDLTATMRNARPRLLVVDAGLLPNVLEVLDDIAETGAQIVVREEEHGDAGDFDRFEVLLDARDDEPEAHVTAADPASLIYTGGSTGVPKGVLVSNFWYLGGALRYREMLEVTSVDVHLGVGQLCHTIGSAVDVLGPVFAGMTTVLTRRFSASRYWDVARRHGCTRTVLVGPVMMTLINQPARADDEDNPLGLVATATGGVASGVIEQFRERFGLDTLELYGQTETGPLGCISQRRHDRPHPSLGTPNGWAEVAVVDADDEPVAAGTVGEIVLRPVLPHSFLLGYWGQPEKFAEACRGLWFHTGDLGHLDADGYLHFDGRASHTIRRRGENLAAAEVEQALLLHPDVADAGVVGVPDALGDEEVKAYIVLSAPVDPADLVRFCEQRIAYFKVPRYVEFVDDLPRSVTKNELERYKLRDRGIGSAWDREAAGVVVARRT